MGIGQKRTCLACGVKFYDLEKDPVTCPKCNSTYNPDSEGKPRRGRKRAADKIDESKLSDIEIDLDEIDVDDDSDDDIADELDEDIRDEMEIEDDEEVVRGKAANGKFIDLEGTNDDIIDSGDDESE